MASKTDGVKWVNLAVLVGVLGLLCVLMLRPWSSPKSGQPNRQKAPPAESQTTLPAGKLSNSIQNGTPVSGWVVDRNSGRKVAGSKIRVALNQQPAIVQQANHRGEFQIYLAPGKYLFSAGLEFQREGTRTAVLYGPEVEVVVSNRPITGLEIPIQLLPQVTVSGQVFDPSGNPLSGCEVFVVWDSLENEDSRLEDFTQIETRTDVSGKFAITSPLVPGEYHVSAFHDDYVQVLGNAEGLTFRVHSGSDPQTYHLNVSFRKLRSKGVVEGKVQDETGQPVVGATVKFEGEDVDYADAVTNDRGEFKSSGEGTGWATVTVLHARYLLTRKEIGFINETGEPGARRAGIVIVVKAATLVLKGVLKDSRGNPQRNSCVRIFPIDGRGNQVNEFIEVKTDQEGKFELTVAPEAIYKFMDSDFRDLEFVSVPPPIVVDKYFLRYSFDRHLTGAELKPVR